MNDNNHLNQKQKQVAVDFDSVANNYESDINQSLSFTGIEHSFFVNVKRDHIIRLASQHFPDLSELDVLDLGCGIGVYHPGLNGRFKQLHGLDVSEQSIQVASEKNPFVRYSAYDGIRFPYMDNQFSLVFAVCVMHHVPPDHWNTVLKELHRVVKPNGLMIIFEHNPYNPATQYIVKNCEIDKDATLLKPRKIKSLAYKTGFEKIYTRTIMTVPPFNQILKGLDSVMGYLPFGAQYYLSAVKKSI